MSQIEDIVLGWRFSGLGKSKGLAKSPLTDRARTPAPSRAALGWLETSIRAYSKYIDVVAKALKDEENDGVAASGRGR